MTPLSKVIGRHSDIRIHFYADDTQLFFHFHFFKKLDSHLAVRIFGKLMHPSVVVKNLGVWFDANFSFADHVRNICKTCFIQIRDLRWVRQYLTDEVAILAANVLVSSHLDYCNSLFSKHTW